jgi:hypothetical protein
VLALSYLPLFLWDLLKKSPGWLMLDVLCLDQHVCIISWHKKGPGPLAADVDQEYLAVTVGALLVKYPADR